MTAKLLNEFANTTPFFIGIFFIAVAIVFEAFFYVEKNHPARGKWLNMVNLFFVSIVNFFAIYYLDRLFAHFHLGLIDLRFVNENIFTQMLSIFILLFLSDFFYYWYHRMMHTIPAMWDIHAVHHSETNYNVTMTVRRHWIEDPLQRVLVSVPLVFFFKLPPFDLPLAMVLDSFQVYFCHMNLRLQLGRLSGVVTGPQLHRLHHSFQPKHIDTNYAQVFPVIDMAFGTYVHPEKDEFPAAGLDDGAQIDSLKEMLFWPFIQWKRKWQNRVK